MAARVWRLKKRFKLALGMAFLLYIALAFHMYGIFWVYPNTTLGNIDISGFTLSRLDEQISQYQGLRYQIRIQNREYTVTYDDLGVQMPHDTIRASVFERNMRPFPLNAIALAKAFFVPTAIEVPLVFTQDFTTYIEQSVFDFSEQEDEVQFDPQEKSLVYVEHEERYRYDEQYLVELLKQRVGNNRTPLYPKLIRVTNEKAAIVANASDRMKQVFLWPLRILVSTQGTTESFLLSEKELAEIARVSLSHDQTTVMLSVHEEALIRIVNEHVKHLKIITRGNVVTPKVIEHMRDILIARFDGHTADALTIDLDTGPNTTGSLADKYIEVDISQQKMYLFVRGVLQKTYRVSTGLEYPTPTGEFTILNKVGLGFSNIYDVWMPWWMGFKYSDELHAYFGIHELPYKEINGTKIPRSSNALGAPSTGGCVALGVGDAQEVYRFADIGTKLVIYN